LLEQVPLSSRLANRYPSQLPGERQRVGPARALAAGPELLLCDEITSALGTSVQVTVLDLLDELRHALGLGLLFVTHNLGVVARIADQVVVLDRGRIREQALITNLLAHPKHPKTCKLLNASPSLSTELATRRVPGILNGAAGATDSDRSVLVRVRDGGVVEVAVCVGFPAVLVFMLVFDVLVFVRPMLVLMDNLGVTVFMTVLLTHKSFPSLIGAVTTQ
jgi:ABC-type glutathione transport system ATPase component